MSCVNYESGPLTANVKCWAWLFQQGRESVEDDPRPGLLNTDSKGTLLTDYLPKKTTMNATYTTATIQHF